jgi:hypothetical protein
MYICRSYIPSLEIFMVSAPMVEGPVLRLYKVSRLDMGAYMCIASNGIPPAVSKRIHLGIDCKSWSRFYGTVSAKNFRIKTVWLDLCL